MSMASNKNLKSMFYCHFWSSTCLTALVIGEPVYRLGQLSLTRASGSLCYTQLIKNTFVLSKNKLHYKTKLFNRWEKNSTRNNKRLKMSFSRKKENGLGSWTMLVLRWRFWYLLSSIVLSLRSYWKECWSAWSRRLLYVRIPFCMFSMS